MLTLIKPDHFYQVRLTPDRLGIYFLLHPNPEFPCAGSRFWSGLRHVIRPKLCGYFKKKRALAMTFVAGGSSLGTLILPILLNNLLSRVGYGKMTLFSAALITFILMIACILIRAPLPTLISKPPMMKSMRKIFKDWPLIMISVGLVTFLELVNSVTDSYLF
jgi:hypothetical protein